MQTGNWGSSALLILLANSYAALRGAINFAKADVLVCSRGLSSNQLLIRRMSIAAAVGASGGSRS
jgi:hypothetical protein